MECKFVPSVCSYCGTGCGVLFEVVNGKIKKTLPMKSQTVDYKRPPGMKRFKSRPKI
jgi:anaerobic selenocysteine-containing dehydrogenase